MQATVLIVEHSEIIRRGLSELLQKRGLFASIREISCAAAMMDAICRYKPDVLFLNPSMVDKDLREKIKNATGLRPRLAAIIYSFHDDSLISIFDETILINDSRAKIIRKINKLADQGPSDTQPSDSGLTSRETDVLKLLVSGHTNKEVSVKLHISTHTVISHRKNINQKLNIKSVAALTVYAILNGIISMDDLK